LYNIFGYASLIRLNRIMNYINILIHNC